MATELYQAYKEMMSEWEQEWRRCYVGYNIYQVVKQEELLDLDETAIAECREFGG